jgi:hypothetical protein
MSDFDSKNEIRLWARSGLSVAALSAIAYLLAFSYERGYASHFGIPPSLIRLSLTTVLQAMIILLGFLLLMFLVVNGLSTILLAHRSNIIYRIILNEWPWLLLILVGYFIYVGTEEKSLFRFTILSILALGVVLSELIQPFLMKRQEKTYLEKLKALERERLERERKEPPTPSLFTYIGGTRGGLFGLRLVILVSVLYFVSASLGVSEAINQKNFLVVERQNDIAVLKIYEGRLICAPFERKTKEVQNSLLIIDSSGQNGLKLNWEEIGPLKLQVKKAVKALP